MTNVLISIATIAVVVLVAFFLSSSSWNRQDLGEDPSTEGRKS